CVDREGRLPGRPVADDQLALAATNRDHGVYRHDAALHRLIDAAALNDAGRNFLQRIKCFRFDRAFAIERLANRVNDAAKQRFADRHLQEAAGCFRLIPFGDFGGVAEQNRTDFSLFEVKRNAVDPIWELDHLVEHYVAQAFDAGDAVAGFPHHADVAFGGGRFQPGNFRFDLFKNAAHGWVWLKLLLKQVESIPHGA